MKIPLRFQHRIHVSKSRALWYVYDDEVQEIIKVFHTVKECVDYLTSTKD